MPLSNLPGAIHFVSYNYHTYSLLLERNVYLLQGHFNRNLLLLLTLFKQLKEIILWACSMPTAVANPLKLIFTPKHFLFSTQVSCSLTTPIQYWLLVILQFVRPTRNLLNFLPWTCLVYFLLVFSLCVQTSCLILIWSRILTTKGQISSLPWQ